MDPGSNQPGSFGMGTKVPGIPKTTNPADMPYATAFDKANVMSQRLKQGVGAPLKPS